LVSPTMLSPALELFIFLGALCFRTYWSKSYKLSKDNE
jgi:hypothetical protein